MLKRGLLLGFLIMGWLSAAAAPVTLDFYFQPGCPDCERIDKLILPQLAEEFPGQYELRRYDTGQEANFLKLIAVMEQMKISRNDTVVMVVSNRVYLGGYRKIANRLSEEIRNCLSNGNSGTVMPSNSIGKEEFLQRQAVSMTLGTIIVAGLLDGVNPCVFSTLVFFLSLLATARVSGRKLVWTGLSYCLACFLTYLALGFGMFRLLHFLSMFKTVQAAVEILMVAALVIMAGISFADAWNFKRKGKAEEVQLQLPRRIKLLIHHILRRSLTYSRLLPGAFVAGVLVTLLEAVCTGQVYLPTLVMLSREVGAFWFLYLLIYNLMFVLPLLLLFWGFFKGISIKRLLQWSKNNVVISKILLGLFFLLLAAVLLGVGHL